LSVSILIFLPRVWVERAVVAEVPHAIQISIKLIWIGALRAVVMGNANLISISITARQGKAPADLITEPRAAGAPRQGAKIKTQGEGDVITRVADQITLPIHQLSASIEDPPSEGLTAVRSTLNTAAALVILAQLPVAQEGILWIHP